MDERPFEITASVVNAENRIVIDGHDITEHVESFRLSHTARREVPQLEVDLVAFTASAAGSAEVSFYPSELRALVDAARAAVANPSVANLAALDAAVKWIEWMGR